MFTPPLGLAYIAGALRKFNHDITAIDAVGEALYGRYPVGSDCCYYWLSPEQIVERIPVETAVIGIGFGFSFEWPYSRKLAQITRDHHANAVLVGGGEYVTALPSESPKESDLDIDARIRP